MDSDLIIFVRDIWQHKPIILVLLVAGFIIFVLLVIDTYRHRKKQKNRHKRLH